jgi:hypothetical protein
VTGVEAFELSMRPQLLDLKWCIAVALAVGLAGVGLAAGLRERLKRPADPVAFQSRSDAWKKLDQELTPAQRYTGPKRARD